MILTGSSPERRRNPPRGFFRVGRWHEEDQGDTAEPLRPRAHAGGGQSMEPSRLPQRADEFDVETEFTVVLVQRKGEGENHEREAMPDR
jgi:hypothetical protein